MEGVLLIEIDMLREEGKTEWRRVFSKSFKATAVDTAPITNRSQVRTRKTI